MGFLRKNTKKQAKWISWLQYKPINLTLRQLTVNGVVHYHKSEAPRSYLENSLSLLSCVMPVFKQAIRSACTITTSELIGKCDPVPCHLLMMIHASSLPLYLVTPNLFAC